MLLQENQLQLKIYSLCSLTPEDLKAKMCNFFQHYIFDNTLFGSIKTNEQVQIIQHKSHLVSIDVVERLLNNPNFYNSYKHFIINQNYKMTLTSLRDIQSLAVNKVKLADAGLIIHSTEYSAKYIALIQKKALTLTTLSGYIENHMKVMAFGMLNNLGDFVSMQYLEIIKPFEIKLLSALFQLIPTKELESLICYLTSNGYSLDSCINVAVILTPFLCAICPFYFLWLNPTQVGELFLEVFIDLGLYSVSSTESTNSVDTELLLKKLNDLEKKIETRNNTDNQAIINATTSAPIPLSTFSNAFDERLNSNRSNYENSIVRNPGTNLFWGSFLGSYLGTITAFAGTYFIFKTPINTILHVANFFKVNHDSPRVHQAVTNYSEGIEQTNEGFVGKEEIEQNFRKK